MIVLLIIPTGIYSIDRANTHNVVSERYYISPFLNAILMNAQLMNQIKYKFHTQELSDIYTKYLKCLWQST